MYRLHPARLGFSLSLGAWLGCAGAVDSAPHDVVEVLASSELTFAGENLIANPSLESPNPAKPSEPASWTPAKWGVNDVVFGYDNVGHTGTRAVSVRVNSISSGDAKWVFEPIAVVPGKSYVYRDYYTASATTKVVAAFTKADGTTTFLTLGTPPVSPDWSTVAYRFTVPADAAKVSVYHLISAVGTLQVDDARLAPPQVADLSSGVPNGAFEQAADLDLRMPLAWNAATWGTNTAAFSYGSFGSVDNHAATLTVSAYTSGDAKWFFDPVPVVPGARYLFTDSYVASAESFVTARITMADGSYRYIQLGRAQPSAALGTARFAFLAPDGAVSATVMHGLSAVGSLTFDDASFVALPPVTITNGVPNAGLEQGGPGETFPSAWYTNSWGVNDATFSYLTRGAAGVHSAGVAIRSLTTGRAAWYFEAQPVNSALVYGFADSYQSDVDTVPLAIVTLSDGTNVNVPLPVAFSSADWAPYSAEIYLPSGATSATVYHQLAKVGYLNTDEYALLPTTPQGFQRGLVSITIDDSWLNDYTEALPVLSARRAVATHYVITGSLGESARMTPAMLRNLAARGHEIAAHTVTHSDLTSLTPAQISNELAQSKAALQASLVGAVTNFASPYGAYNRSVVTDSRGLFRSHRTTDVGFNSKGSFDPYRLKVQNIRSTTTLAELNGWVARAARERLWLILVYHDVVASGGSIYSCTPAALDAHLAAIQAARLPIVTVNQALTEVTRQVP